MKTDIIKKLSLTILTTCILITGSFYINNIENNDNVVNAEENVAKTTLTQAIAFVMASMGVAIGELTNSNVINNLLTRFEQLATFETLWLGTLASTIVIKVENGKQQFTIAKETYNNIVSFINDYIDSISLNGSYYDNVGYQSSIIGYFNGNKNAHDFVLSPSINNLGLGTAQNNTTVNPTSVNYNVVQNVYNNAINLYDLPLNSNREITLYTYPNQNYTIKTILAKTNNGLGLTTYTINRPSGTTVDYWNALGLSKIELQSYSNEITDYRLALLRDGNYMRPLLIIKFIDTLNRVCYRISQMSGYIQTSYFDVDENEIVIEGLLSNINAYQSNQNYIVVDQYGNIVGTNDSSLVIDPTVQQNNIATGINNWWNNVKGEISSWFGNDVITGVDGLDDINIGSELSGAISNLNEASDGINVNYNDMINEFVQSGELEAVTELASIPTNIFIALNDNGLAMPVVVSLIIGLVALVL